MLYSRIVGGVKLTKNVSVPEQAAMFLSVLSHHKKNCVVKHDFIWSDRTVSKHFHAVMLALCKLHKILLAKPTLITDECADPRWKWFKFIYVLSEWEGNATDSRVLRDALHRPSGLHVPTASEFQTRHIKVYKLKYQECWHYYEEHVKEAQRSFQMSPFAEYVEKNLHSPSYASESDATKSHLTSLRSVSSYSFTTNVASIKVTNATTIEEQLASLMRAIEGLTKHVQEPDAQIAQLINKADNVDASHIMGKQVEAHDEVEAPAKQHYTVKDKYGNELEISSDRLILVDQLKEFIEGTIRSKIEGRSKSSLTYSMPYTPRIGSLKMPIGYQPPKFEQFDGKGNPKQHVAHFIETCNNEGTYGDYLVKQFVRSLKGNAFD
ncbi:UNVERIFIED_CONTAM: hypothetical protein Sradi_6874500 [Sesamum radiatum]|uniref:DUF8040 domain-containing protein n=1 Tax=Sesamum radiatum TaxID=300843 RepID=A0AAW2JJZ3_SESRA